MKTNPMNQRPLLDAVVTGLFETGIVGNLMCVTRHVRWWFEVRGCRYELIVGATPWARRVSAGDVRSLQRYRKSLTNRRLQSALPGRPRRGRTVLVTRCGWSQAVARLATSRRITLLRLPRDYVHRPEEDPAGAPFRVDARGVKLIIELFPDLEAEVERELRVTRQGHPRQRPRSGVLRDRLWTVNRALPSDWEPYGTRPRAGGDDCSSGCRYFLKLPGGLGLDWGVCINRRSARAGLLTFEHQGCEEFKAGKAPRV